jgi:hypothetical protein
MHLRSTFPSARASRSALAGACLLLPIAGVVASRATGGVVQRQHVTVSESNYRLQAPGLQSLHAGFVTITVRENATGEHGLNVLRLKRPLTRKQIVVQLNKNNFNDFDALGGVAVVPPQGSWEATIELVPGRYVIVDGGVNGGKPNYGRGMLETFNVAPGRPAGTPPTAVGRIVMADYSFRISLPKPFNGKGVVAIPNRGQHLHEIALVKTPAGKTAKDVLMLFHSGAPPGPGYEVHELLATLDGGRTAYVRLALQRGHYVALCLVQFGNSNKTHADAGMVGEFDVS